MPPLLETSLPDAPHHWSALCMRKPDLTVSRILPLQGLTLRPERPVCKGRGALTRPVCSHQFLRTAERRVGFLRPVFPMADSDTSAQCWWLLAPASRRQSYSQCLAGPPQPLTAPDLPLALPTLPQRTFPSNLASSLPCQNLPWLLIALGAPCSSPWAAAPPAISPAPGTMRPHPHPAHAPRPRPSAGLNKARPLLRSRPSRNPLVHSHAHEHTLSHTFTTHVHTYTHTFIHGHTHTHRACSHTHAP